MRFSLTINKMESWIATKICRLSTVTKTCWSIKTVWMNAAFRGPWWGLEAMKTSTTKSQWSPTQPRISQFLTQGLLKWRTCSSARSRARLRRMLEHLRLVIIKSSTAKGQEISAEVFPFSTKTINTAQLSNLSRRSKISETSSQSKQKNHSKWRKSIGTCLSNWKWPRKQQQRSFQSKISVTLKTRSGTQVAWKEATWTSTQWRRFNSMTSHHCCIQEAKRCSSLRSHWNWVESHRTNRIGPHLHYRKCLAQVMSQRSTRYTKTFTLLIWRMISVRLRTISRRKRRRTCI